MADRRVRAGRVVSVDPARREARVTVPEGRAKTFEEIDWLDAEFAGGEKLRYRIASCRVRGDVAIVAFVPGVTRDNVRRLPNAIVYVEAVEEERADDELRGGDVIGFSVVDESGALLGEVAGWLETVAHDVIEIGRSDGQSLLVPLINETVADIDTDARRIIVRDLRPFAIHGGETRRA